jgi:uncharacterized protein DUF4349/putative zinc finger protein
MKHEISELLPFYANGTLDEPDRARVESELAHCAACADELQQYEALASALRARAGAAPGLPPRVLDAALARINTPPVAAASTRLRTAWWGVPARYATAAALVVGVSAAGFAAWHARDAETASSTVASTAAGTPAASEKSTLIYRVTPGQIAQPQLRAPANAAPPPSLEKQHRLAKKARLELLVRDVEATLKSAQATVRGAGGEVTSLSDANPRTGGDVHAAGLEVEVPAARLDDTLDRLGLLGTVQNRAIDAQDVDAAIVDQEARLRNLRREETDLRALMDRGGKVTDILTVQQNLSAVRGEIEQLDAHHQSDLHRVATSTISIALTEDRPNGAPAKPGPSARIDGAWHSGLNTLGDTLVALISGIAWCVAYSPVPLALAGCVYTAMRLVGRRRATAP